MKKLYKKINYFTLVELIIVIAIIAILSVVAFMTITKWIGYTRDSKRLGDINIIQKSLEEYVLGEGIQKYPYPDNYSGIYDISGNLMWYQGFFGDGLYKKFNNLNRVPKDTIDISNYGYSIDNTRLKYQIKAVLENSKVAGNILLEAGNLVYASDSVIKLVGNYDGILLSISGNENKIRSVPGLFMWSGTVLLSGENSLLEDGEPINNYVYVRNVDISELLDTDDNNDGLAISRIIQNFSGSGLTSPSIIKSKLKQYPQVSINVDAPLCIADCTGKICGDDGCGGTCGSCGGSESCVSGACVSANKTCYCRYETVKMWSYTRFIDGHLETRVKSVNPTYPIFECDSGRLSGTEANCTALNPGTTLGDILYSYHARTAGIGQPLYGAYHLKRGGNRWDACRCTDTQWDCWMHSSYCPEAPGGGEACRPNGCSYPSRP